MISKPRQCSEGRGERTTLRGFLERLPSPSLQTRQEMALLGAVGKAA